MQQKKIPKVFSQRAYKTQDCLMKNYLDTTSIFCHSFSYFQVYLLNREKSTPFEYESLLDTICTHGLTRLREKLDLWQSELNTLQMLLVSGLM